MYLGNDDCWSISHTVQWQSHDKSVTPVAQKDSETFLWFSETEENYVYTL